MQNLIPGVTIGDGMAGQSNAAPVIIKRKKIIVGGGHHGGAWKVAYADFVTAMMAFFMLMWLLNATTEKQRKGIADYFNPTVPINRISGGGDGAFGGDSVFTEQTLSQVGTGASQQSPTEADKARGEAVEDAKGDARVFDRVEQALSARGGESMVMEQALRHIVTKVTDEGFVIEIYDLADVPLFQGATDDPAPILRDIASLISGTLQLVSNEVAVNGHVRSQPITLIDNPVWDLSTSRAQAVRRLLTDTGVSPDQIQRIGGFADRKTVTPDPTALRNNRIEVVILRRDR
jgi:chemotaxis protein MotB